MIIKQYFLVLNEILMIFFGLNNTCQRQTRQLIFSLAVTKKKVLNFRSANTFVTHQL